MINLANPLDVAAGIATVLGVGMLVPQALTMFRTQDFRGLSSSWIGGGVAINAGWVVYALSVELFGLLPVSLGALVLYLWMAAMLARGAQRLFTRALISAGAIAATFAVAAVLGGATALGLLIALTYSAQFAPAAWSAIRADDVSGVSVTTWAMALVEAVIWAAYGAAVGDAALTLGGTGASVMSILVLVGVFLGRRTASARSFGRAARWSRELSISVSKK